MLDVEKYPNINRIWTGLLIENLAQRGIDTFFTSPGLRNAPILSSVQLNEKTNVHSGIDERSMAYRALGYSKATGRPGVLVCTSGTAMANYLPTVIEAYQTNIPLIIISADRPRKLIEWGDNQSILQPKLFGEYVQDELDLETASANIPAQEYLDKLCRFLNKKRIPGPLHINMPFEDPLDTTIDNTSDEYRALASKAGSSIQIEKQKIDFDLPTICSDKKALIVVGPTPECQDKSLIKKLITSSQLPCLLDIGSGLKFSDIESTRILPSFEHPEIKQFLEKNKPELIIHLGGRLVSKHYYSFLKENLDIDLLLVGNEGLYTHPAQAPTWEVKVPLNVFCQKALDNEYLLNQLPYTFDCKTIIGVKEDIIENSPFSFPSISKRVIELLPDNSSLYLGNSTTIRSFDAFASTRCHSKNIKVLTHRGASGIEGFNAAALGYAEESNEATILVHGDIGFMHDLGSLLMYKNKKIPLINLVVNNNGGGIFKHLPISKDKETLPLITTEHDHDYQGLCSWLKIEYHQVTNIDELETAFTNSIRKQSICFIEAKIDQEQNMSVYERLKTLKL